MTEMIPRIAIPVPTSTDHAYNELNWPDYAAAVSASGGEPVRIALDLFPRDLASLAATCHGVLLPGSPADVDPTRYGQTPEEGTAPADPTRERTDIYLLEHAESSGKPLLGICFGTQMLNVWRGGTLLQDLAPIPVNHSAGRAVAIAHTAVIAAESTLRGIVGSEAALPINSSHHQAVGLLGQGLCVSARTREDDVVEAIEAAASSCSSFLLGVQWHPERHFAEDFASQALFRSFIAHAAAHPTRESAHAETAPSSGR